MKWSNFFFNVDFKDSIQRGIDEFARASGYQVTERTQIDNNKNLAPQKIRSLLLACFLMITTICIIIFVSQH